MSEGTDTSTVTDSDDIPSFFRHTTIFITGVTGFLGHVLVSKLLSSCPDIRKIYVLMRQKRNRDVNERFRELFDAPIFEKLKNDNPKVFFKMAAIEGDCLEPNLGISEKDQITLQNEVNIVFHVAATVKFDAPLRDAVNINVRSTRDLLEIAKKMKHLKSFVHVSTAFSHCAERKFIEEKLYEAPMPASSLITLVDQLSDQVVDKITPTLLGSFPNTYVFTKAVAEGLFTSKSLDLPTSIFRPGIVISTAKEPIPGWINNLYGPTGLVAAAGIGLVHTLHSNKDCKANIVPCDYVINALVAVAWYTAKHWKPLKMNLEKLDDEEVRPVPVFNYSSSATKKSLTWHQFMDGNVDMEPEMPFSHSVIQK
ncbi:hypothetical protein V9T40_008387 [Parthenolecanium corni]|uniref:Fatty acyl-CoA reductase n=1 Tax=Parthenolecanium corni TaxID=536013 RepID=A0AAN9TQB4_9HEMI